MAYCCAGDAGQMAHVQTTEAKPGSRETLSYQANIWAQHIVVGPTILDLLGLRGHEDDDGIYISTESDV